MRISMSLAGGVVPALLTACGGPSDGPSREFIAVPLQATAQAAGEIGRAFLLPEGEGTRVRIEVSGVPPEVTSRPVHLYTLIYEGSCDRLGAQPAYALTERVLAQSPSVGAIAPAAGPFTVSNTAPIPLEKLRAGEFAIVVKTSPADGNWEIFCGNVR